MKYTAQYFIDKFTLIPEDKWTTGVLNNGKACCVLGHCGLIEFYNSIDDYPEEIIALIVMFSKLIKNKGRPWDQLSNVYEINDYKSLPYFQSTPKERILAALNDLKNMGL